MAAPPTTQAIQTNVSLPVSFRPRYAALMAGALGSDQPSAYERQRHACAESKADPIANGEADRVVVELVAAGQQPDAAEPQEQQAGHRPQQQRGAVERGA